MNILRACYDWRVLGGLAVLGLGVYLAAPGLILAALPLLLVAVCPLSMLLMMRAMNGQPADPQLPPRPAALDRETALRGELAELARRQEEVVAELRQAEASRRDTAASDVRAPAPLKGG